MRIIDADALKALFDERYDDAFMQSHTRPNIAHWEGYSCGVNWGRNTIADAPTIDAEPVVHGRWKYSHFGCGQYAVYRCTVCEKTTEGNWHNYCPKCGAKMVGGT